LKPADAKTVADFLLATLDYEIPLTKGVIGAVPADKCTYQPDALSKTALGLVRHITLEDEWFLNAIADGQFSPQPDHSDLCGLLTPADAVARYGERIPAAAARVRALEPEALTKKINMFGAFEMPAIGFLGLMVRHSVHHRGQLSSYLRAMGARVPGIYGPSADTVKMSV
jgi:uncharacterized damage-inducible protein DinB